MMINIKRSAQIIYHYWEKNNQGLVVNKISTEYLQLLNLSKELDKMIKF